MRREGEAYNGTDNSVSLRTTPATIDRSIHCFFFIWSRQPPLTSDLDLRQQLRLCAATRISVKLRIMPRKIRLFHRNLLYVTRPVQICWVETWQSVSLVVGFYSRPKIFMHGSVDLVKKTGGPYTLTKLSGLKKQNMMARKIRKRMMIKSVRQDVDNHKSFPIQH